MKFSVQGNDFYTAISKVIGVSPVRSTLPILGNIYLKLESNNLNILGTDLEVYVNYSLEVNGKVNGAITIPAKKIFEITQNLSDKELNIEVNNNLKLTIKTSAGKWTISGIDPDEFPMPAKFTDFQKININSNLFVRYLFKTIHAASSDELRRSMNGVNFELKNSELKIVATDGHRLVKIIKKDFVYLGNQLTILVPIKTCTLLTKLLKNDDNSDVEIEFSREFIKCIYKNITLISRLIDDAFPNYESVIPIDNDKKLKIKKDELISAVKRSIIMSDTVTNRTSFTINGNELKVRSANNEFGTDSEEELQCEFTENEEFDIAFNGKYLLEALYHFDSEEILFDFSTPLKASILSPSIQEENEEMIMLVMPVRNN